MKRLLFIFLFSVVAFARGQNVPVKDTVITKDPNISGREYWVTRSVNGRTITTGFMLNGVRDGVCREYNDMSMLIKIT